MVVPNRPERASLPRCAVATTRAAVRHENILSVLGQGRHWGERFGLYALQMTSAVLAKTDVTYGPVG